MAKDNFQEFEPPDRAWTDHPLFHGINASTLATITSHITVRRYQQGATLFRQDDVATHLFVIRSGEVQIRREFDGQDLVIEVLGREEIFGEMGLLTDYKRTASVVAATPLEVLVVTKEAFDILISQNFEVARELVQIHNARSLAIERATAIGAAGGVLPAPSSREQARLAATMEHHVLTVFSPGGGTGKTMLACNLGVLLARKMPSNVVLVDLSLMASQCALVLNVGGKRSVAAYISGGGLRDLESFDALTWHKDLLGQHGSGLGVLSMAHSAIEAVTLTPETVEVVLTSLRRIFPIVLVDTTSVYSDVVLAAIGKATRLLLVSHYELTGLRGMMECVTALADPDSPLESRSAFILNNTRARPAIPAQEFEARVKLAVYSQLPYGEELPSIAARDGTPVVEMKAQSALARELGQLADRLVAVPATSQRR